MPAASRPMPAVLPATSEAGGPLRVALVGGGKMAEHHARAIASTATPAKLVAVADPSDAGRAAIARIAPQVEGYATFNELLRAQRPDVVHVVTPLDTHFQLARQALEAGCHVYVEKPVVERVHEIDELVGLARSRQRSLCAGHQLLFEEPARQALELLPAIGRVCHVESYFAFRPSRRTAAGRVALRADLQLLDILPHPVYLLLHFLEAASLGNPDEAMTLTVGKDGTVHGILRRGDVSGALTVTLNGRPVDSYVRIVGTNGTIHADFVRGTVQRQIGPGSSGIDKALAPYRIARQLVSGTTRALFRRISRRQRSYPGLTELFEAFYRSIRAGGPAPISAVTIGETVRVCEQVGSAISALTSTGPVPTLQAGAPSILLTGGTGFLGRAIARELVALGCAVRVVARRAPAPWDRTAGVDYRVGDLSAASLAEALNGVDVAIHAAAETAGGWQEHAANSIQATEQLLRGAAAAGTRRIIHVSSLAVLASAGGRKIDEQTPLLADSKSAGPYVWGKLESERLAERLAAELGIAVRIVRPGPIVDYQNFEPPGRLGKRLGNIFVAVGSPRDRMGIVGLDFAARMLASLALDFDEAPPRLNLLDPDPPLKSALLARLRHNNPDLSVFWLPMWILKPISVAAIALQKLIRPGRAAIDVAKVFRIDQYDTQLSAALARRLEEKKRP